MPRSINRCRDDFCHAHGYFFVASFARMKSVPLEKVVIDKCPYCVDHSPSDR